MLPVMASAFIAACAARAGAGESQNLEIPYGNLGLNWASDKINEANSSLENDTGASLIFDYYATLLTNPYGGERQGTNYNHIMIFGANLDLEKSLGLKGGSLVVSGGYNSGGDLSDKIGNFFTASEANVTTGLMFYELYYQQNFNASFGNLQFRIGRMSMSDVFMGLSAFDYLVSGGMDSTPAAVFSNAPYTSSTIATWGVMGEVQVGEMAFAAGLYQIPKNIASPNWDGLDFGIASDDGYMAIFQGTWTPTFNLGSGGFSGLGGTYEAGAWFFGGYDMHAFEGGGTRGNGYGFYIQGQQQIWVDPSNSNAYVSAWAGAQYAPVQSIAIMPWMLYSGIQLQGLVPGRPNDGIYLSWMYGYFSSDYSKSCGYNASYEMVVEFTYVVQLNEYISIQPDMQYIFRPNGNDNIDDALVVGGQLMVSF